MTRPLLMLALGVLPACTSAVVDGRVADDSGQALPGVVVQISGVDRQVQTDARGHFRISFPRSDARLQFSKSGYASAELSIDAAGRRRRTVAARLWKLPPNAGVYLYDGSRYARAGWVLPESFFMADGTVAYGTRHDPTPATHAREPVIIAYRTPRYDARLSRLVQAEAAQPGTKTKAFSVWTAAGTETANLVPINPPQDTLLRLKLNEPLEPGAYAVHWGALDGYTTLDNRIFMFQILEPDAQPIPTVDAEAARGAGQPAPPLEGL